MQPPQGRGLGRVAVGRIGASGVFAAFLRRHDVACGANQRVAEAFEHLRDFVAEVVAGHRVKRLDAGGDGGGQAGEFLPV
jgi:hypothetical protein